MLSRCFTCSIIIVPHFRLAMVCTGELGCVILLVDSCHSVIVQLYGLMNHSETARSIETYWSYYFDGPFADIYWIGWRAASYTHLVCPIWQNTRSNVKDHEISVDCWNAVCFRWSWFSTHIHACLVHSCLIMKLRERIRCSVETQLVCGLYSMPSNRS